MKTLHSIVRKFRMLGSATQTLHLHSSSILMKHSKISGSSKTLSKTLLLLLTVMDWASTSMKQLISKQATLSPCNKSFFFLNYWSVLMLYLLCADFFLAHNTSQHPRTVFCLSLLPLILIYFVFMYHPLTCPNVCMCSIASYLNSIVYIVSVYIFQSWQ